MEVDNIVVRVSSTGSGRELAEHGGTALGLGETRATMVSTTVFCKRSKENFWFCAVGVLETGVF
jgi:hypothetical protein